MDNNKQFKINNCTIIVDEHVAIFEAKDGAIKHNLQPKIVELICYLADHHPRVIPRQELIDKIWNGNEYVGEKALTNAIWHVRKLFTEYQNQEIIETIRKVGYKLSVTPVLLTPAGREDVTTEHEKLQTSFTNIYAAVTLTILVVIFGVWLFGRNEVKVETTSVKTITSGPGSELFPAPSPDGSHLVYAWTNLDGDRDLYLAHTKEPTVPVRKLTHDGLVQGISAWSPDGKYLYFAKKSRPDRTCKIIQFNVQALEEKPIVDCPFVGGYYYLDTSYDGKTLIFHGREQGLNVSGIYYLYLEENNRIERFSCVTDCQHKDRDVSYSPDSTKFALSRRTGRFRENLFIVDIATGKEEQITQDIEDIVGLTWSPEGDKVVFGIQVADIRQGYVYNLNDKSLSPLNVDGFSYPAFAKDSGELFFQQREERYHISTLPLDTKTPTSPFPILESAFSQNHPDYSEQTGKLVYVSNESGFYELWLANPDGSNREQLTQLGLTIQYPRWSHNGEKIAFLAPSKDNMGDSLYIYNIKSKRIQTVSTGYKKHYRPTWAEGDKALVAAITVDGQTNLHSIDVETNQITKLSTDRGRFGFLYASGDLIYSRSSGGLWHRNINTPKTRTNLVSKSELGSVYAWLPTNKDLYYHSYKGNKLIMSRFSFTDKSKKDIYQMPAGSISANASLSYFPEQHAIFAPFQELSQSDIKQLFHPLLP